MKTNTVTNKLCAALLGLCIPACGLESPGPDSSDALELEDRSGGAYSGEELFLAIFFGQGEAARHLPLTWGDCGEDARKAAIARMPPEVLVAELDRMLANPANEVLAPKLQQAREVILAGGIQQSDERVYGTIVELVHAQDPEYMERLAEIVYSGDRVAIQEVIGHGREIIRDIILAEEQPPFDPGEGQGIVEVAVVFVAVAAFVVVWLEVLVVNGPHLEQSVIFEEMMVEEIATQLAVY